MSMPWKPLGENVIVLKLEGEEELTQTKSGILIADTAKQDPPNVGEVVAVGPGRRNDDGKIEALELKKGDVVIYSKYAGTDFNFKGDEFKVLREDDIKARRGK